MIKATQLYDLKRYIIKTIVKSQAFYTDRKLGTSPASYADQYKHCGIKTGEINQ